MAETPAAAVFEPWDGDGTRQREAMLFGLWVFLATEVLFFGGLFLLYAHARTFAWSSFEEGARDANPWFGTANTVVLMTSSLTAAVAERAIKAGWGRLARWGWIATIALGLTFLVVKGFEYAEDVREDLLPALSFKFHTAGAIEFWNFYWVVTIVHAIHLSIGLVLMARLLLLDRKGVIAARWQAAEVTTVYWHLIDVVWVFLYPLIYLVGRGGG